MPELTRLRDQTCIAGIGETEYTRGTPKSALELALEASIGAIEDAGISPEAIDAGILPNGAGSGGTAGDFSANLGLQDLIHCLLFSLASVFFAAASTKYATMWAVASSFPMSMLHTSRSWS